MRFNPPIYSVTEYTWTRRSGLDLGSGDKDDWFREGLVRNFGPVTGIKVQGICEYILQFRNVHEIYDFQHTRVLYFFVLS